MITIMTELVDFASLDDDEVFELAFELVFVGDAVLLCFVLPPASAMSTVSIFGPGRSVTEVSVGL